MHKHRLIFSLLLVCLALVSVPAFSAAPEAAPAPAAEAAPVDAPAAEAPVAPACPAPLDLLRGDFGPAPCGSFCDVEGQRGGCTSGPGTRVICYCTNGTWAC